MILTSLETELKASNTALRQKLAFKNSHIAMLEERLLRMSVELASSRAREDEQNLLLRQSTQLSQVQGSATMTMSEDDDSMLPVDLDDVSDSIKSVLTQPSSSSNIHSLPARSRRVSDSNSHSLPARSRRVTESDNISYSLRSLALSVASTGAGSGIIGNMTKFDRSDRSENLRVDFPTGGRRNTIDLVEHPTVTFNSLAPAAPNQRRTVIEQLFRSSQTRKRPLTEDAATEIFEQDEREGGPSHRKSNPKLLHDQDYSRLIGSTVLFPGEDDNYSLGFE